MATILPEHVIEHINDFRFGATSDWKSKFNTVTKDMDNWFYHFKEVYEHVHYMDVNDDDELIDFIRVSLLMNLRPWVGLKYYY